MNLLIAQCKPEPDLESRTMFTWDFDHETIDKQKEEAAFFMISVLSDDKKDFYFTSIINSNNSDRPDLYDAWIEHSIAALSSLKQNFYRDAWHDIINRAYELALYVYCDETLAEHIKEYRCFVITQ